MKRLRKRFAAFCLTAAALLAVAIGAGLPRIQYYSADLIARLFPVTYQVTYRNTGAQPVTAPVRFAADNAIVSASASDVDDKVIPMSDAVFVCLQNELRAQNMLRSGLLTGVVVLTAALLPITLAAMAFAISMPRVRNSVKRRVPAAPHRPAACARQTSTIPSVA